MQTPADVCEEDGAPCHMEQPHKGLSQAGLVYGQEKTELKTKMKVQNLDANVEIQHGNDRPIANRVPRHLQRHVMSHGQTGRLKMESLFGMCLFGFQDLSLQTDHTLN